MTNGTRKADPEGKQVERTKVRRSAVNRRMATPTRMEKQLDRRAMERRKCHA